MKKRQRKKLLLRAGISGPNTITVVADGRLKPGDIYLAPSRRLGESDQEWFERWVIVTSCRNT